MLVSFYRITASRTIRARTLNSLTPSNITWSISTSASLSRVAVLTRKMSTASVPVATAKSLDHIVLTVKDLDATVKFYEDVLGMKHEAFSSPKAPDVQRHALLFGEQKINLHISGKEFEPKAQTVQPGSGDLCFLVNQSVDEVS